MLLCPGEPSCQSQEADGDEKKAGRKLSFGFCASGLSSANFYLLVFRCIGEKRVFQDKSWNGNGRRSAEGSAAHESTQISLSVGSLLSSAFLSARSLSHSCLFFSALFFSRFLATISPTARKRLRPPPHRRNGNLVSPKSASELAQRYCDAFNLDFQKSYVFLFFFFNYF